MPACKPLCLARCECRTLGKDGNADERGTIGPQRQRPASLFQSRAYPINGFFFRPSRMRIAPMMASTSETG